MDRATKAIILCFFALIAIPVLVGMNQPEFDPQWLVNDATIIGHGGAQAAEEWQAEQDAITESYYEPVYYYSNSYWYESDDADAEADAKEWIAQRESGGDYNARNGQYIGRYQLSEDKLCGDWSEEHQEEVADAYVQDRYGSWEAAKDFWQQNGWY